MDVVELDRGAEDLQHARQDADAHAEALDEPDDVEHRVGLAAARDEDHAMHVAIADRLRDVGEAGDVVDVALQRHPRDDLDLHAPGALAQLADDRLGRGRLAEDEDSARACV